AQVVSGIGFLGAGTILRDGNRVKGLTTAASLWVCAGIGLAIGQGFYFAGIATSIISFLSLLYLGKFEKAVLSDINNHLLVIGKERSGLIGEIGTILGNNNITIKKMDINEIGKLESGENLIEIDLFIRRSIAKNDYDFLESLKEIEGVESVEIKGKGLKIGN
ncbi:MgtC/SapB family protein, partial [Vibrio sp. 2304]|uniref:MgtC/SapB family protein n=1 Tax=Vibrio sp. 2304 TaxID=3074601 RepID=UPI0029650C45